MYRPAEARDFFRRLPTTDLYFLNPLRRGGDGSAERPPRPETLGGNLYAIGDTVIVSRYATAHDLQRLRRRRPRRIVYIADDDFEAGAADARLPESYRARLAAFVAGAWPCLRDMADICIVPTDEIARAYGARARILDPVWHRPPAGTGHFRAPRRVDIVCLGTGSHRADLLPLAPALAAVLDRHPQVRLTLFLGRAVPPPLAGHPQVRALRPLPWWLYKQILPRMRFHLALYPLLEGRFNAGRSANKLFEAGIVGAASLMSSNPALRRFAGNGLADIFVDGGAGEWQSRIEEAIIDLAATRERAGRARAHILHSGTIERAAGEWRSLIGQATNRT